ncbi:ferric reductase-like transmembrane domain-containing protein [Sphingopyxis sp. DBS4]|jgi:predicted ferric reductase|uniref:ferredoxin reductase family protein n=1 Tax=Sphingopyxis sp. DBS4 TaxID=2968500 RepID=UPI00214BBCC9|nr:ferric reductase-like transmembrane domain-containing protein [Sphingopyxis sp. DBS4]
MRNLRLTFWGLAALVTMLWLLADLSIFRSSGFFAIRNAAVQYSGALAIVCMSVAMMLAIRPRWPEHGLGGLDKMYRLHKWLGIAALVTAIAHWLWAKGPKWAVGWGWLERPSRGPQPPASNPVEALFASLRHTAEGLGEWAFYAVVALIAVALIQRIPYRFFYRTHRLLALAYLVLVFHAVILTTFGYWLSPFGLTLAALLACGTGAAILILSRRAGRDRQVFGRIAAIHHYPGVQALETIVDMGEGWPGHRPGQFAFAVSDPAEGPHPYTIASAWREDERRITFITKGLGDHTRRLPEKLRVGQEVRIEGPYGCFTFDDDCARQIWIGGGIGITPFIARMKYLAQSASGSHPEIDLFHCTAEADDEALGKLQADAAAAHIRLHVLVDARDGRLDGERIRAAVPEWREASLWFCGPLGFGETLRRDFAALGFPVAKRFHQELFAMR